jgi:hypothetical protein
VIPYGYGNVYRTYPQGILQQELPTLPVGDPPAFMPPWDQEGPAVYQAWWRIWRPYLSSAHFQQEVPPRVQVGDPPVGLLAPWPEQLTPQWWRDPWPSSFYQRLPTIPPPPPVVVAALFPPLPNYAYELYYRDLPSSYSQRLKLLGVGDPPVGLEAPWPPALTQWLRDPLAASFTQRLTLVPIPPPIITAAIFPPPEEWGYELYYRDFSWSFTQRQRLLQVGDPPITFPELGQWAPPQYFRYWPQNETATRLRLLAVGDPPALPVLEQPPYPLAALSQNFFQRRPLSVQEVVVVAPPAFPPAWIANWAAYFASPLGRAFFQALPTMPIGDSAVRFIPPNLLASYLQPGPATRQVLPFVIPVIIPPTDTPIQGTKAWLHGLYYRDIPVEYFQRLGLLATVPSIPFVIELPMPLADASSLMFALTGSSILVSPLLASEPIVLTLVGEPTISATLADSIDLICILRGDA